LSEVHKIAVRVEEAAVLVSMHPNAVRRAIYSRGLATVQFGKNKPHYIAVADLIAWFNKKKKTL
jgi:hypothetical protein